MDSQGRPTAADIDDAAFLEIVDRLSTTPEARIVRLDAETGERIDDSVFSHERLPRWVSIWEVQRELYDQFPPKVIAAKFAKLAKRGLVSGCPCGCRGDIELLDAGRALI